MNQKGIISALLCSAMLFSAFSGFGKVSIKGKIENPLSEEIQFSYYSFDGVWLDYIPSEHTAKLDKNGKFSIAFDVPSDFTLVKILHGNQATEIYTNEDADLMMTLDANNFDSTLEYKGEGAQMANFMAKHMLEMGFVNNYYQAERDAHMKEPQEFLAAIEEVVKKERDFLIDNGAGLPQNFINMWDADYEYRKYYSIIRYPNMHEIYKQKSYNVDVPDENYTVVLTVPEKFNDSYLPLQAYRMYVTEYYTTSLQAKGVKSELSKEEQNIFIYTKANELAKLNMPMGSKQYYFAHQMYQGVKYSPIASSKEKYDNFVANFPDSDYNKFLKKTLDKKISLSSGHPAIDFPIYGADNVKGKLSDLKGKVVYVDFWASWCGPCKVEFKHNSEIKKHFKGKDVAFVYVSIDEDEAAWKEAMKKYHLVGYHNRVSGWKGDIAKDYNINSVPSYFIIDKEGNFAVDTAPRPSNTEKLIETIEELL